MATTTQPSWRDAQAARSYINSARDLYERQPAVKVTVQLVLSVFAVAFFVFFAIRPTLTTITELLRKIEEQRVVDQQLDRKITQLEAAQVELTENQADIPLIKLAVPEDPDLEGFARRLEVLATEENAELATVQFQTIPIVGDRLSISEDSSVTPSSGGRGNLFATFNFTINGNQESIISFLRKLETIDRAVAITRITFSLPPLQQQRFYTLTAAGRGTIYYEPEIER